MFLGASEAGGGKAVTLKVGKAACTHVLVKHKGQSSYDWGLKAQKPLINRCGFGTAMRLLKCCLCKTRYVWYH